jgi:hypothetical protein
VQGTVRLEIVIGTDGHVGSAQTVSGDPLLVGAAKDAVMKWLYTPVTSGGQPIEVATTADVVFVLPQSGAPSSGREAQPVPERSLRVTPNERDDNSKPRSPESVAVLLEDITFRALHTKPVEAVEGNKIYFKSPPTGDPFARDPTRGEKLPIYRATPTLRTVSGDPIKWRAVKVGDVVVTEERRGEFLVGAYSGQPLTKELNDYLIIRF